MKKTLFAVIVLSLLMGCARQRPVQMTLQEQETAKKEIGEAVDVIFQNLQKMDAEALFQSYSDTLHFMLITTDGTMADLQKARYGHAAWFKAFSSMTVTTSQEEFRFLPGNTVICSWIGKFDMILKTGGRLQIDRFGTTFVFMKIDDQWKVVYQQSSALPPVPGKPIK